MVDGRIGKFYKENCLMDQPFVKDGDHDRGAVHRARPPRSWAARSRSSDFVRFEKGEGLEKREDNFADEVASMIK